MRESFSPSLSPLRRLICSCVDSAPCPIGAQPSIRRNKTQSFFCRLRMRGRLQYPSRHIQSFKKLTEFAPSHSDLLLIGRIRFAKDPLTETLADQNITRPIVHVHLTARSSPIHKDEGLSM